MKHLHSWGDNKNFDWHCYGNVEVFVSRMLLVPQLACNMHYVKISLFLIL